MTISKNLDGSRLTLFIEGKIDTVTSPELEKEIKSYINDISTLTLDFGNVDYISSAGLRVILATKKEMNRHGELYLVNVSGPVKEIFEMTGFSEVLNIE